MAGALVSSRMTPELLATFRADLDAITDASLPAWLVDGARLCAATLARRAEQVERFKRCLVCGETPAGDYQVTDATWAACGWEKREGVACLGCLAARLEERAGRELELRDIKPDCASNGAILWALGNLPPTAPTDLEVRAARWIGSASAVFRGVVVPDSSPHAETVDRLLREADRWPAAVDWDEEVSAPPSSRAARKATEPQRRMLYALLREEHLTQTEDGPIDVEALSVGEASRLIGVGVVRRADAIGFGAGEVQDA